MSDIGAPYSDFLPAGTKVVREAYFNEDTSLTAEYGVIVHCWLNDEISAYDCYVAFFGTNPPSVQQGEKPYVLRYASESLKVLDSWPILGTK